MSLREREVNEAVDLLVDDVVLDQVAEWRVEATLKGCRVHAGASERLLGLEALESDDQALGQAPQAHLLGRLLVLAALGAVPRIVAGQPLGFGEELQALVEFDGTTAHSRWLLATRRTLDPLQPAQIGADLLRLEQPPHIELKTKVAAAAAAAGAEKLAESGERERLVARHEQYVVVERRVLGHVERLKAGADERAPEGGLVEQLARAQRHDERQAERVAGQRAHARLVARPVAVLALAVAVGRAVAFRAATQRWLRLPFVVSCW